MGQHFVYQSTFCLYFRSLLVIIHNFANGCSDRLYIWLQIMATHRLCQGNICSMKIRLQCLMGENHLFCSQRQAFWNCVCKVLKILAVGLNKHFQNLPVLAVLMFGPLQCLLNFVLQTSNLLCNRQIKKPRVFPAPEVNELGEQSRLKPEVGLSHYSGFLLSSILTSVQVLHSF